MQIIFNNDGIRKIYEKATEFEKEVAREVVIEAKRLVPVDTGALRDSISVIDGSPMAVVADAPYSLYVELGTRHMAAQPYLMPALDIVSRKRISH
jgi:HK97 gp10 family phage protein